ncbi:DUF488 domain-containing protein [Paraburkholderia fynbosensis]|uniref:DUF488 domain-containing protein n=1 Tax=Paraburkholderia fynbosensis TaxID=1200993 RepID=A0A6J5GT30_9BURK|nr:DUF488 family protein [Paraburkholderia fynbosensis]CAB3806461.1 hypothetical protein LMG27177_06080 [Paraburkholderia fynbosensis]
MPHASTRNLKIVIQRAYEDPGPADGYRVLVDRVWPRGRSKGTLKLNQWARELAPSSALREWFGHDPKRWSVFQQRYRDELGSDEMCERMRQLLSDSAGQQITLVYGAKDEEHNQAIVLRDVLLQLHDK